MKKVMALFFTACMAVMCNPSANAQSATSAPTPQNSATTRAVAKEGEKVWVIVNYIKADKRQQFEKFIHEVFWPMAQKLSAGDQQLFRQTRVLHPTAAEADGTYSYIFLMDPLVEGGDYDIESLLKKMYGEAKAKEYYALFEETAAREQTQYLMVQSRD